MTNLSGANLNNGAAVGPQGEGRDSPSRFPKYPAYKDSGVDWLGEVPEDWVPIPFKYIAEFVNGMAFKPEHWSETGVPIIRIENLNNGEDFNCYEGSVNTRYHVNNGDLLFGWSGNRGTSFGPFLWGGIGLHYLNQHIFRIAEFQCDKKWLFWTLKAVTKTIEDQAHGIIGMVHVTKGKLGGIKIPSLPWHEQTQIARFLDHETARIDALIAEQQRLIELLKEKRQAVISHAVTKGLDPAVPMKDSGVEWLGEVPAHWEVKRLRYLLKSNGLIRGPFGGDLKKEIFVERGIKVYEQKNAIYRDVSLGDSFITQDKFSEMRRFEVKAGDYIMSCSGTIGRVYRIPEGAPTGIINQALLVIRFSDSLSFDFADWIFVADFFVNQIIDNSQGGAMKNLVGMDVFTSISMPVPPMQEQLSIAKYLIGEINSFDSLISTAGQAVNLMQERRSALISAAVTGKIDVRSWQPPASTPAPEPVVAEAV